MPIVTREADLQLDFLVIGAGASGLAAAYVLSTAGHRVRVLEKNDFNRPSGGVRIPPNISKILREWVGKEELATVTSLNVGSPLPSMHTGESIGYLHWTPAVMAETGGEFLVMHREDLIKILYQLATKAGAQIDLNTPVTAIQQGTESQPRPRVTLANGEVLSADLLIGADGCSSMVRRVVLGREDKPEPAGLTVYTGVVKGEDMMKDPELKPLLLADEWPTWMGQHRCMLAHPVHGKKDFFIGIYSWYGLDGLEQGGQENWDELVPAEKVIVKTDCSVVRRLVTLASKLIRTQWMKHEDERWIDETGRIVLLGDAAHPSYPGGTHTAAMAVEDAVVFGSLFSHIRTNEQITSYLESFQELRQSRCNVVRQGELDNLQLMCLPDGPAADARNEDVSRTGLTDWDDGSLKAQFEAISSIFGYDAGDAAEEWWVSWGRFSETARARTDSLVGFDFSTVSTVTNKTHDNP